MKLKALSLSAVIGFILATVPSCGTPAGNCGPNNCTGCCNAGTCVTPDKLTDAACGSSGNACSNCSASSQTCNMGTKSCIGTVATGGGTSGTGGGTSGTGGGTSGTGGGTSGTGGGTSGTGGGMASLMPCDPLNPMCGPGTECVLTDVNGSAGRCVPGACSLLQQNCTNPNSKCTVIPVGDGGVERVCTPFTLGDGGTVDNGACQQAIPDSCQRGAQCVALQGGGGPTCRRFCGPFNMCPAGSDCNFGVAFGAIPGGATELHLTCSAVVLCNPFDQSPCPSTEACQFVGGATPRCSPSGPVTNGGVCTNMDFCGRGLQCVASAGGGAMGTCRAFCNLDGGAPACTAGMCQNLMNTGIGSCTM
jgi:hypothetical protein